MESLAIFDPILDKSPGGAITMGQKVKFCVKTNIACRANAVTLRVRFCNDDYVSVPMTLVKQDFVGEYVFDRPGHYFYHFRLDYNDFTKFLCKTYNSFSYVSAEPKDDFFQLVTRKPYLSLDCLQGGVIYQILVDRFYSYGKVTAREPLFLRDDWGGKIKKYTNSPVKINEEVFGGNLAGVEKKLPYLSSLGVTAIYLNPICEANSHHKYDTADFLKVDSMFGGDEALEKLISSANKYNIKIFLDGVFNHTGSDSVYFNKLSRYPSVGAYNSTSSKYYPWYTFNSYPNLYNSWWGIDTLPSIRRDSEDFQNFIAGSGGVLEKYLNMGVSGFRLDVVDEISDSFTKKISDKILSYSENNIVMGEVWEDASTKESYGERRTYFSENELNSVMNYPVKDGILNYIKFKDSASLESALRMIMCNYPKAVRDNLMNFLGTHDTPRFFSELLLATGENREKAKTLYKIALAILFTLPGVPSIFYGDEYGMENNDGSSRGCFDWENQESEITCYVKFLSQVRKLSVFKDGDFEILLSSSGKFVYSRYDTNYHIVCAFNLRPSPLIVSLQGNFISLSSGKKIDSLILLENEMEIIIEAN